MSERKSPIGTLLLILFVALAAVAIWRGWIEHLNKILPPLEWQALTPEFIILAMALMIPLFAQWSTDRYAARQFALLALGLAGVVTFGSLMGWRWDVPGSADFTLEYIGETPGDVYGITEASQTFKLLFLVVAFLAVMGQGRPLMGKAEEDQAEFISLILFATLGMMVVASAQDLIVLFLGIETASLSSYLLAGFRRDQAGSEAALKYFTIGAVSSGMTLFGISLLFGMAGTTDIAAIGEAVVRGGAFDAMSLVAIVLVLGGLAFKVSALPFQAWAPDVYDGSPPPVAGMLAAASKAMGFVALFQVFLIGLAGVKGNWEIIIALIAIATMTFGNLVALRQNSLRRMLAYSSIAQAGYLLIAIAVGTWYAVGGGILHLWVNAFMKLGAFLIIGVLLYNGIPDQVDKYKGLGRRAPILAFAMAIFLLSMAGLPPFGGFMSKFVLFSGAVDASFTDGAGWLFWLAVAAVINSAISLFYYVRVIRAMYVQDDNDTREIHIGGGARTAIGICLAAVLVIGLYPQWFLELSMDAAIDLVGP